MPFLQRFLTFFFHHLYTNLAWAYDLVAWIVSLGHWKGWVLSVLEADDLRSPILEVGHGPGHLLQELHERGMQPIGMDISYNMNRIAARRIRQSGMIPRVILATAVNLPFPDSSFGMILSTFPTEYIVDERTLRELWRVLRPGGTVRIVAMAVIQGSGLLARAAIWLFRWTGQYRPLPSGWAEPAESIGFTAQAIHVEKQGSRVTQLALKKPHDDLRSKE